MSQGWYKSKPIDDDTTDKNYHRLDFIDYENKIEYYCTRGNDCAYCRYAPHARSKNECIYVDVVKYTGKKYGFD